MTGSGKRVLICAIAAIALLGACGEPEDDASGDVSHEVSLEAYDFYFEPTEFSFDLGERVTIDYINNGEATHSFTAPDLDIDIEADSAETTEFKFSVPDQPGIFDFYCKYHPDEMKGTISLGGGEEPIEEQDGNDEDDDDDIDVDVEDEDDQDAGGAGNDY